MEWYIAHGSTFSVAFGDIRTSGLVTRRRRYRFRCQAGSFKGWVAKGNFEVMGASHPGDPELERIVAMRV